MSKTKVKKELTPEEQAKAEAGKAKALAIAKQREAEAQAAIDERVQTIQNQWQAAGGSAEALAQLCTQLEDEISQAKKKTRKQLQQVLQAVRELA